MLFGHSGHELQRFENLVFSKFRDHSLFIAGGGLVISIINQIENS